MVASEPKGDDIVFTAPTFADPEHADSEVEVDPEAPGYRDRDGEPPPGEALAVYLSTALSAHWDVPARWTTPYGHAFEVRAGRSRFDLELRVHGVACRDWHLSLAPRRGLFSWLRSSVDPSAQKRLRLQIADALDTHPRIEGVQWRRPGG